MPKPVIQEPQPILRQKARSFKDFETNKAKKLVECEEEVALVWGRQDESHLALNIHGEARHLAKNQELE